MNRVNRSRTYTLAESALLLAMSTVLSLIPIVPMPLGGKITPLSMLPVCLVSVRHGTKWGLGTAFCYSLIQLALGVGEILSWGLTPLMLAGCFFFDYLLAFTVLGLAGLFRKQGIRGTLGGVTLALSCRFLSHFLSGVVIFRELGQWEVFGQVFSGAPALYSAAYNGFFMLPETVFTVLALFLLSRGKTLRSILTGGSENEKM